MKYKKIILLLTVLISSSVYGESNNQHCNKSNQTKHYYERHYDRHKEYDRQRSINQTRPTVKITPRKWKPQY